MSVRETKSQRIVTDILQLIENNHDVVSLNGSNEYCVKFHGPKGTVYENGVWKVRVYLPDGYPFKSPSIGFVSRIYHPNIDENSGSICLDVINQSWTPICDLRNIFEIFLPQLLTYPNPTDPLNIDAAKIYLNKPEVFKEKVAFYIKRYAKAASTFEDDSFSSIATSDESESEQ